MSTMNYILVRSDAVQSEQSSVSLPGPTYIDFFTTNDKLTPLEAGLKRVLKAKGPLESQLQKPLETCLTIPRPSSLPFPKHYKVKKPPLAVLNHFTEKHGYQLFTENTIGGTCTCMWILQPKPTGTTEPSTQTGAAI